MALVVLLLMVPMLPTVRATRPGIDGLHPNSAGMRAMAGDVYLAHDFLVALGKPPQLPGRFSPGTEPAWQAATAWALAIPITHLTVLRAHLLTVRRLQRLLDLRELTGLHLALVCHRPRLTAALQQGLFPVAHILTGDPVIALRLYGPPAVDSNLAVGRTHERWITLPALEHFGSMDSSSRCIGVCTPPMIGWKHRPQPRPRTEATTREVVRRIHACTGRPRLAAALAAAVFTAAAAHRLATVRLQDYDQQAATLALHDPARFVDGCATHGVPPWAQVFLRAAAWFIKLAPTEGRLLLIQPHDFMRLLNLAEAVKLRPPQPAARHRTGAPGRVEWDCFEMREAEHDAVLLATRSSRQRWNTGRRN